MMSAIMNHLPEILSGASILFTALIGFLHLAHKDDVANSLQKLEDGLSAIKK